MKTLGLLWLGVALTGCATVGAPPPSVEPSSGPSSGQLSGSAHWMASSAEYQALVRQTFALAGQRLREVVADQQPESWTVAVDADETVISNVEYERELTRLGLESNDALWDAWVARRAAPPLPGAIEFLELVHELGGYVAVVTNRSDEHRADTEANFRAFDIPFDVILCRKEDRQKEPRWEMLRQGTASAELPPLEIVMWVGDNIRDFPDLDQDLHLAGRQAFVDFGRVYFLMPNPLYGSWEENPRD